MSRTKIAKYMAAIGVLSVALLIVMPAWGATDDSEETQLEQTLALAAEQTTVLQPVPSQLKGTMQVTHPLFVGVDDTALSTYLGDPAIPEWLPQFTGFQIWGAAFDVDNNKVYFNNGSTLYEWPVGGSVTSLGTIVDGGGATQSMVALAFYDGVLYGTKNIANEAIWIIDPTTLVATVFIDYVDADLDCGGLAADPNTGTFYCTNDDSTPYGVGLVIVNPDASVTPVAAYPAGETDIDGLAVSDTGIAYLITDQTGNFYPYDLIGGAYGTPFANPWGSSEVFCGGTWLYEAGGEPTIVCNTAAITIPDGVAAPYPSDIVVAGQPTSLTDVNVQLFGLSHTYPDDIDILLVGPQGENLIVMSDAGGGNDVSAVDLVLDDAAAGSLPDSSQITSGAYQPTNWIAGDTFPAPAPTPSAATTLATFNGTDPNGTWSLYVHDDAGGDSGSLAGGWCLEFNSGAVNAEISLAKTVGTVAGVCATTDSITVSAGTTVYYCYEVTNTGNVELNLHDLVDDQLGTIFSGLAYVLAPGASVDTVQAGLSISAVINTTTTNTATWTGYVAGGPSAQATDSATVTVEFLPDIDVTPTSLLSSQLTNQVVVLPLTIGNVGDALLDWEVLEAELELPENPNAQPAPEPVFDVPERVTSAADCPAFVDYPGREPEGWAEFCGQGVGEPGAYDSPGSPDSTGYALDIGYISDNFVSFTLNNFPGQTVIGAQPAAIYGMDFDPAGTVLYALNDATGQLGTLDLATGAFTGLVACPPPGGATSWTGLAIDPVTGTFYGSTTVNLYTIDPATGASTLVGPFNVSSGLMIAIAVNAVGEMYGHDIATDSIYSIDRATGAATLLGPTGYLANFAQGMDFDNEDGTLYIFLYQGSGANVYGTVDLTTGAVTPLATSNPQGEFEGATQTVAGCVPSDYPWLSVNPTAGTTPAGGSSPVDVTFDSTGIAVGTYDALLCVLSNDPDEPLVEVPVTMEVVIPVELMGISIE